MPDFVAQTGHSGQVAALAFSPDGRWLASGGADKKVRVWDLSSGYEWRAYSGCDSVTVIAFDPKGESLACGDRENGVTVWKVKDGRSVFHVRVARPGAGTYVTAIGFSQDAGVVGSRHGAYVKPKFWELSAGKETGEVAIPASSGSSDLSPDKRFRAICRARGEFKAALIEEVAGGKELFWLRHDEGVRVAVFSPDGRWVATGDDGGVIRIWDAENGAMRTEFKGVARPEGDLVFSRDGKWLATSRSKNDSFNKTDVVRLWDLSQGIQVNRFGGRWVRSVCFSPDSRLLVAGGYADYAIQAWDVISGKNIQRINVGDDQIDAFFSADGGSIIASSVGDLDVYDLKSGSVKTKVCDHAYGSGVSPDGHLAIIKNSRGRFELWDVDNAVLIRELRDPMASNMGWKMTISPDGFQAAASISWVEKGPLYGENVDHGEVTVWDIDSGRIRQRLNRGPGWTWALAFTPDSRFLFTGNFMDGLIKKWETNSGMLVQTLAGHAGTVEGLAVSADGKWLASAGDDCTVRLWDAQTGEERARLVARSDTDDWTVVTPEGLFDGSRLGIQRLGAWRIGGTMVGPELFFNEFYYPGLLAEVIAGKRPLPPRDIARVDRRQPLVKLVLENAKLTAEGAIIGRQATVAVSVSEVAAGAGREQGCGGQDLRLFRNGALVKVWHGDVLNGKPQAVLKTPVTLVAGANVLTAYCFNRDNVKSEDAELTVNGEKKLERPGTAHILAVGIDRYANPGYNLKYAAADAQAMAKGMEAEQRKLGRFKRFETVMLLNEKATKANILAAVRQLARKSPPAGNLAKAPAGGFSPSAPEDLVVFYFASHGASKGARFYLVPHDLGYQGAREGLGAIELDKLLACSISDQELEKELENIDARETLLIIDACNSGQALEAEERRRGPMNSQGLAQLAYEKGMDILTAAQSYQAALEAEELGHGFLSYVLAEEGLKTPAADSSPADGSVGVREWYDHAVRRVPELQENYMEYAQRSGRAVAFLEGEQRIAETRERNVQRPRQFFRREPDAEPLVVATPAKK